MKTLSILQPWAWLIVTGQKDIENRSWPTKVRGRIFVHAGKTYTRETHLQFCENMPHVRLPDFDIIKAETGAIVGSVDIVDCVMHHPSPWKDAGSFGFVLANPEPCGPVRWRGQLGFFEVDPLDVHNAAMNKGLFE